MRFALPVANATINDPFWTPRREVVRTSTIPQQEAQLRSHGQVDALALDWKPGDREPHIFWESDLAKWIEAASYTLVHHPDAALDAALDDVIARLAGAQQDDGYLNSYFTTVGQGRRFTDLHDAHELYCLGHLVEAAVAHKQATGKDSLLDVVQHFLDLVDAEFSPGGSCEGGYCGHEELELALVRLADLTGEQRHLDLALRMVEARGTSPFYFDLEKQRRGDTPGYFGTVLSDDPQRRRKQAEYNQSHAPVREQDEAVGHSVRAMYLYMAMADLAARMGDDSLRAACETLWESVTERKMYVTGGIGADASIEGFRGDYDLPNNISYNETCASIGLVMWAQRMALLTGEARYLDVAELALYNTVLAGCSSDGTQYFYGNPMMSDGEHARQGWFDCACCPPNFARLLTSLEGYAWSHGEREAVVNLFVGGQVRFPLAAGEVGVTIETRYPWEGSVALTVTDAASFALLVRVPAWASGAAGSGATATLNGEAIELTVRDGFLTIDRDWAAGDQVVLELPLPVRRVWAHPAVSADVGLVALQRGPLVLCAESTDNSAAVGSLVVPRESEFTTGWDETLDVVTVTGAALGQVADATGEALYPETAPVLEATELTAIPYFAWGNRGTSSMRVWLRDEN